jgi:hypothetical protein
MAEMKAPRSRHQCANRHLAVEGSDMKRIALTAMLVTALLGAPVPATVSAASPGNDNFANATPITTLPFSESIDNTEATSEPGEPGSPCSFAQQSIWYVLTASTTGGLALDMNGSSFSDTVVNLYRGGGGGFGSLSWVTCAQFGGSLTASVSAGSTYYIQAGDAFGGGGMLSLHVQMVPAPANDDFAGATSAQPLPFSASYDLRPASRETGEPLASCGSGSPTVWYTYQASTNATLTASLSDYGSNVAVYRGTSLGALSLVDCAAYRVSTFEVIAGETYYFQVGGQYDQARSGTFNLFVTPPPDVAIYFGPSDPSIFDVMQFFPQVSDPGGVGVETVAWDFGDGSTGAGFGATHSYAADGDYTVRLTVTTFDGRSASASQRVSVRTHDVAITKFSVPTSASTGQTRSTTVGVSNRRYPEQASVTLYKLTSGSSVQVGSSNGAVPIRSGNRTTDFSFSYTFTADDARLGKVSFFAIVSLAGSRDAFLGDNQAQALPTKVNK